MSIKFKLMLTIDTLVMAAVAMFGSILYTSENAVLQKQMLLARENVLQSLANVTAESLLSQDEEMLISYTAGLKHIISELEVAYVLSGQVILAHTDKKLAPRPLPLSYSGRRIRGHTENLLVKSKFVEPDKTNISFSGKTIYVNGQSYNIAVGYSDLKVREHIKAALDSVFVRIVKTGLLVILAATILTLLLSGLMIKPLNALVRAFIVMGSGNLEHRIKDSGRRDEIGLLNREFNRMVDKLKELDQLKKDFVSSVTHELKSPIGAIESYLDLMSYEIKKSMNDPGSWIARLPRFAENIDFIKQNSGRLLRFITDLLDVARIEKGKFEIFRKLSSMEPVIQDTVKLFMERARTSGIQLSSSISGGNLPQIYIDGERISQVLTNLVSNALKWTPEGGKVTVTASLVSAHGNPDASWRHSRAIRVSVEDTGSGIPQAELNKIFEKFHQAPGSRKNVLGPKGTGLGLYIAKSIVESHGGRIFVESSGKGSKFSFELPV